VNELIKNRVALTLILAGVLAAGILYFFYLPAQSRVGLGQTENAALQQEIDGLTEFLRSAETANHYSEALASERNSTLSELYSIDSLEAFIDDLTATLEALGMSSIYISPVIEELLAPPTLELDGIKLARLKFDIEAQGEFISGGQALEQIEEQRYYIAVPQLSIDHDDGIAPEVTWSFQLQAYFRTGGRPHG
jgi:hypothetical protein